MVQSYAIKVDGKTIVALNDGEQADRLLDEYIKIHTASTTGEVPVENTDKSDEKPDVIKVAAGVIPDAGLKDKEESEDTLTDDASFKYELLEDVAVSYEYAPAGALKEYDDAINILLSSTKVVFEPIQLLGNEKIDDLLSTYEMTYEEFSSLNPAFAGKLSNLTAAVVKQTVPLIRVVTTEVVEYDKEVPYSTSEIEDDTLYTGEDMVETKGENGLMHISEKITRVNGQVLRTEILSNRVLIESVTEVVRKGTKERPADVGSGNFIPPYDGWISSYFGTRSSGKHTGLDICGTLGDPIVASDNGEVIFAGWSGGYGYLVQIDHKNGYITYYAHCSKLLVKEGDVVSQGDIIANLGSTGNSTGPHVHFEVRLDGEILNPLNFIME